MTNTAAQQAVDHHKSQGEGEVPVNYRVPVNTSKCLRDSFKGIESRVISILLEKWEKKRYVRRIRGIKQQEREEEFYKSRDSPMMPRRKNATGQRLDRTA
jgi:hypothetical protein